MQRCIDWIRVLRIDLQKPMGNHAASVVEHLLPNAVILTAGEVASLRKDAMTTISLIQERAKVVADLPADCHAPASLDKYYPSKQGANHIDVPSDIQ